MTTRFLSLGSLRTMAASYRRGHLAGSVGSSASSWSAPVDRDLDRVAADLLVLSHAGPVELAASEVAHSVAEPVDLNHRRGRGVRPVGSGPVHTHARAS